MIKMFCFALAEKGYWYSQINNNSGYALSCLQGLESEGGGGATRTFCSWNTIKATTFIRLTSTVLGLSCTFREEKNTLNRMASSLKPIPPPPTSLTCRFMSQPVAGIPAPVVFQMLCTEWQQIVYVDAPSTPGMFFSRFPLVHFH